MDPDYHLILDTLADAVVVGDRAGRITYANPAAERLLNWDKGTLHGQPLTAIIPAHLRMRHTAGFNRYRSTWAPRILGKGIRVAALRKGGSEVRIELTITAYRGRGGEELYLASLRPLARHTPEEERAPAGAAAAQDPMGLPLALFQESPSPEQLARKLVELLARRFQASLAQLWIHDRESASLRLIRPSLEPVPLSRKPIELPLAGNATPLGEAGRTLKPMALSAATAEGPLAGVEAGVVVPLHQAGELFGVLAYGCDPPVPETTVRTLETLALLVTGSLQALRLRELQAEREAWANHVELLRRLTRTPAEGREHRAVLQEALQGAAEIGGFDGGLVLRAEGDGWRVEAGWGYRPPLEGVLLPAFPELEPLRDGAEAIRLDEPAIRRGGFPALRQRGSKALIAAPIRAGEATTGLVLLESRQVGRHLSPHDEALVQSLAEQAARL